MVGSALAGCAAGSVIGIQRRSFSSLCLGCASFGALAAAADFTKVYDTLEKPERSALVTSAGLAARKPVQTDVQE